MTINEAREIVAEADNSKTIRAQLSPKVIKAAGFIEAYEQFEPLVEALENVHKLPRTTRNSSGKMFAWAQEALKTFREGKK